MQAPHCLRLYKHIFVLLYCTTLLGATGATPGEAGKELEKSNVPPIQRVAVTFSKGQNEGASLHPHISWNPMVGKPSGGHESSELRRRQRQWHRSRVSVVTAGLVAAVCLAVSFVVLQCARKTLFPRLLGSVGKRRLSDSDEVDRWISDCDGSDDDESVDEGVDEGAVGGGELSEERGESQALEALEALKRTVTLCLETAPYLPGHNQAFLVVLLMAICMQELVLLGVYSTPAVEMERRRTLDFILESGRQTLAGFDVTVQRCEAARTARKMFDLMEHCRTLRQDGDLKELAVEASISALRISPLERALLLLQPWVKRSTALPECVYKQLIRILTYARKDGKTRIWADPKANAWVLEMQNQAGFTEIFRPKQSKSAYVYRRSFANEEEILTRRYTRLTNTIFHSVLSALSDASLEQSEPKTSHHWVKQQQEDQQTIHHHQQLLERRRQAHFQKKEQHRRQNQNILHQQQHQWTNHPSNINPGPSSILQPLAEQPPAQTAGVMTLASHPNQALLPPHQPTLPAPSSSSLGLPTLQSTQPFPRDFRANAPTPQDEFWRQPTADSSPSEQAMQPGTKEHFLSASAASASKAVLRADAPEFRPGKYSNTEMQHHPPTPLFSNIEEIWQYVPPPPGFAVPWRPVPPSMTLERGLPLRSPSAEGRPSAAPPHPQSGHHIPMLPVSSSAPDSLTSPRSPWHSPQFPEPSSTVPAPTQLSQGQPHGFPQHTHHSRTSVPSHPPADAQRFYGVPRQLPVSHVAARDAFWPPEGEGASQGGIHSHSLVGTTDPNPLGNWMDPAFAHTEGPGGRQSAQQGPLPYPPSNAYHPSQRGLGNNPES